MIYMTGWFLLHLLMFRVVRAGLNALGVPPTGVAALAALSYMVNYSNLMNPGLTMKVDIRHVLERVVGPKDVCDIKPWELLVVMRDLRGFLRHGCMPGHINGSVPENWLTFAVAPWVFNGSRVVGTAALSDPPCLILVLLPQCLLHVHCACHSCHFFCTSGPTRSKALARLRWCSRGLHGLTTTL